MKRHWITAGLLALAATLYAVGAALSAAVLLVLGGIAELAFWIRLLIRRP